MKIAFLSSIHPMFDKRVYEKEALALAGAGHEVCHIAPGMPGERRSAAGKSPVELIPYSKPRGKWGRVRGLITLCRLARRSRADCYHCNEVDSWLVGLYLKCTRRCLVVFDVHEHYPSRILESRLPLPLRWIGTKLLRLLFRCGGAMTDGIVFAKRTVESDFAKVRTRKVLVANYAPLSVMDLESDRDSIPEPSGGQSVLTDVLPERVKIIHLGLFSRRRGWPQVLDAMAMARNRQLLLEVVGTMDDGTMEQFVARVRELNLQSRVSTVEWLPFDQAYHRVRQADIGLVAFQPGTLNHVYALPHKLFDYMLAGIPVIVPRIAEEIASIVSEADCGFVVDTASAVALAHAFDTLAADPAMRSRLGQNGRRAVIERYNWENEAAKLLGLYDALGARALSHPACKRSLSSEMR